VIRLIGSIWRERTAPAIGLTTGAGIEKFGGRDFTATLYPSNPFLLSRGIMPVIAHVILRNTSADQYDAVRSETGWLTQHPAGGLAHLTWWEGNDCHNIDAWENEAAFGAFANDRLAPAMSRAGVMVQPEVSFHAAHEVFLPKALTVS
jgi:hypothetical protein